jgi:hypothetical protein
VQFPEEIQEVRQRAAETIDKPPPYPLHGAPPI